MKDRWKKLLNYLFKKNPIIIENPIELWLASDPLSEQELLSIPSIEKLFHIKWNENIVINPNLIQQIQNLKQENNYPIITMEQVQNGQRQIINNCVIRWLDDGINWVVTLKAGKKLEKGFLCLYAGVLTNISKDEKLSYSEREYFLSIIKNKNFNIGIDSRQVGNIARFFPFLLDQSALSAFEIDPVTIDLIATANLQFQLVNLNGAIVPAVFVSETITSYPNKEIMLGLNYSLEYLYKMLQINNNFQFYDKNTLAKIDGNLFRQKLYTVALRGLSYSFSVSHLRILIAYHDPSLIFKTYGYDDENNQFEITFSNKDLIDGFERWNGTGSIMINPQLNKQ